MRLLSLFLLCCALSLSQKGAAQQGQVQSYTIPKYILSTKPQGLILGLNAQLEHPLSNRWSLQHELYYRGWQEVVRQDEMLAAATNLKWYFAGEVGNGLYLRLKAMGGLSLEPNETSYTHFLGAGLGLGVQRPIGRRWFYGFDLGFKVVPPLGGGSRDHAEPHFNLDYLFVAPTSIFDIGFSIGFRL